MTDPRHLDFKRAYERMFATCARQDEALATLRQERDRAVERSTEMESRCWKLEAEGETLRRERDAMNAALLNFEADGAMECSEPGPGCGKCWRCRARALCTFPPHHRDEALGTPGGETPAVCRKCGEVNPSPAHVFYYEGCDPPGHAGR